MGVWISQLRKGLVEFCILLVVGGEETYGYSLVQRLRAFPNLRLTEGTVYPALSRLIEDGLVRVTERPSPLGPRRRYLSLTSPDRRRLDEMQKHWSGVCDSVDKLMRATREGNDDEK